MGEEDLRPGLLVGCRVTDVKWLMASRRYSENQSFFFVVANPDRTVNDTNKKRLGLEMGLKIITAAGISLVILLNKYTWTDTVSPPTIKNQRSLIAVTVDENSYLAAILIRSSDRTVRTAKLASENGEEKEFQLLGVVGAATSMVKQSGDDYVVEGFLIPDIYGPSDYRQCTQMLGSKSKPFISLTY